MKNVSFFVPIGTRLRVEVEGMQEQFVSRLIGQDADRFLIIKTPVLPGSGVSRSYLVPGARMVIRCVSRGRVWAFRTRLLRALVASLNVAFIHYPDDLEIHELRADSRVDCLMPGMLLRDDDEFKGVVTDLSLSGARIELRPPGEFRLEEEVKILLELPGTGGSFESRAEVRNVQESSSRQTILGLRLLLDEKSREKLADFMERVCAVGGQESGESED